MLQPDHGVLTFKAVLTRLWHVQAAGQASQRATGLPHLHRHVASFSCSHSGKPRLAGQDTLVSKC